MTPVQKCLEMGMVQNRYVTEAGPEQPFRCLDLFVFVWCIMIYCTCGGELFFLSPSGIEYHCLVTLCQRHMLRYLRNRRQNQDYYQFSCLVDQIIFLEPDDHGVLDD